MILGVIYKATCRVNGKQYVGQTATKLSNRMRSHKYQSTHGSETKFHRAIRKYGWDVFEWEVVCDEIPEDQLPSMERFFIELYDTFKNGYNSTEGGDVSPMKHPEVRKKCAESQSGDKSAWFGKKHSEETKKKISEGNKGKVRSEEVKKKLSDINTGRKVSKTEPWVIEKKEKMTGEGNHFFGRHHSDETKSLLRQKMIGRKLSKEHVAKIIEQAGKEYVVTDPDGNTFEIKSLHRFCKEHGLTSANAYAVVWGKQKQHKGWKFRLKE